MVSNVAQTGENSSAAETNSKKSKKKSGPQYECVITCLDGSVINTSVEKSAKGEELVNKVAQELDVKSKDYVGLLFNNGTRQWLDIHKDMKHQLGDSKAEFLFRVKFYEPEPSKIQEDHLRYLLYLQIREDLSEKRLKCTEEVIAQLGAYTAQAEVGDFNLSEHEHDYLKDYEFAENTDILERINLLHKQHRGQTPLQAELNFLEIAKKIPRYGVDVHDAMDTNGHVEIGIAALGINIYRDGKREQLFRWQNMHDFNYNRRKFTIKLKQPVSDNDNKKNYVYYFESAKSCKQCYKVAVEYHSFFRLTRPDAPRKRADTLKMGSSFRYSDRTLYQLRYQKGDEAPKNAANFKRTPSTRKTLPPSYKTPLIEPEVPFIEPTKVAPLEEEPVHYEEVPVQYEEVEFDEANPDDDNFDPEEWETVEKTMPDGSKKKSRRRVIVLNVVKKPKSGKSPVEEPVQYYEEVEVDEANPDDDKFDPKEWETVENTMPDGSKKKFRRRNIVLNVVKKPKIGKSPVEEPVQYNEEVEFDEANPDDDKYDPEEWETVEKKMPDGSKKKFRRRIIVLNVVKKQKSGKSPVEEEPVQYEQVEVDEANPDDDKFDPKEWETVEKTMPDGSKKKFRRRIIVLNVVKKPKSGKSPVEEEPVQYEEVEVDEANPDDDKYDPKEWETVEKTMPDGSKKKFRRRIIVLNVVKKPKSGDEEKPSEVDEEPIEYEEVEIDEANPQDDQFDPKEWEVVEKEKPNGDKVRVRRRRVVILKIVKEPEDLVNENEVTVEEMPLNENAPTQEDDDKFDPEEWETIEKMEPDGKVKKYRRRISIVRIVRKSDEEPVDEKDCQVEEVPFDESENDLYDPDEWTEVERTRPDGSVKKYRRRLHVMKIVKNPSPENEDGVNYEEEEITEDNPDDPEKYDPEEWEDLVKTQPDGTVKKYRRRIVVVKYVKPGEKGEEGEKPVGRRPIDEDVIACGEEVVDESSPNFNELLEDPEFEVVHKKRPDGTIVRVKRRAMRVKVSNGKQLVLDECPMEFEETELDEDSQEFIDALDDPESEIIEKKKSDGTIIRVRRRAVNVHVRKPAHTRVTISSHPVRRPSNEDADLSYEEIPVDENSPVHFDKNIWEEYDKVMPDGTTKKYRRRYISKCNVILKKPSFRAEPTPVETSSNLSSDVKYEEVEIGPDDEQDFNKDDWEVIEKEQPDGTKKRFRRRVITTTVMTTYTTTRYVINADGEEDNMMESKPIETTTLTFVDGKPVATSSQDGLDESLSPVEMSMSMDDLISKINQMSTSLEQPAPEKPAPKKNVVTIETITPATTFVVESAPYDEEEARKRQEEERLEQEGLNATIDSIFTLPDDDEVRPLSSRRSTYDEDAYNESFDHELEEYGVEAFPDNTTAETDGIDINLPDPTVRKKKPKTAPKPRRPESFVKMTPTPRSSGSESDDHRMNRTKSDASNEQRDYRPHSQAGDSEIIYTVTDVSMVEQGAGGFVKAVKAKHENLAHEEQSPPTTPKGHVPTRTISFDENDTANVIKTTEPPSVPVEVTTIIPAESELPIEDVIFETNQPQEESFPDMEENIEAMEVPEVETEVILIKQVSNEDVRVAPPNSEPGVVRTRPFSLPRQDTQVIKTEIIEVDLTPSQMESFTEDEGDFVVNTEQLPTEVITKTITIEGDSTEFTQEEIQKLLSQAPEQVGDIGSITSTQVVRTTTFQKTITGKTITVSGDAEDDELQRMLREAVTSETNQMVTTDEDGNVIITAIQDEIVEVDDDGDDTEV
uniref:FERM domain-containing protein n=1 Tax=Clytia hemisphaerica TaxID=252671 RepID=A0A7M5V674_9CNID